MASDDRTPRQTAIALILATQRPSELFPILAAHPIARAPDVVDELEAIAADLERFGQSGAAKHLGHVVRIMRATFDRLEQLTQITSRAELLVPLRESTIVWSPSFYELAEVLAKEADATDPERARLLRRGLAVRAEMNAGLEILHRICSAPTTTYEQLKSTPLLRDPLFHEYVLLLVRNNIDDPEQAEAWRRAVAGLAESCRVLAEEEAKSGIEPITFDEAAAWHLFGVSSVLLEVMSVAASVAADGLIPLRDVISRLVAIATHAPTELTRVMLAMTFLENACRMEPRAAPLFLAEMRHVVGTEIAYPDRQRATNVLHYTMSLLLRWRSMPYTADVLADAERLVAEVIPEVDPQRGPRLARDLHWHRGLLLQNLGEWEPSRFADAVSEFRIALNTPPRLQHEHVARGMILSDLANALQQYHLHEGTLTREVEDERQGLFQEALHLLNAESEPVRRSALLGNVAIFLNERKGGDLGLNQERALDHVLEAIRLLDTLDEDDNPLVRERRAGLERTRGNILYSRLYGDPYDMAEAAIAAHDKALAYCDANQHWLRGTIQFNRANACARLARRDAKHAQTAYYAYEEARSLLRGDRVHAAQALAAQAAVMFSDASLRAQAIDQMREAISEVQSFGGSAAAAPRILQLGTWLLTDAQTREQFQAAATTLIEAIAAYEGRGDVAGAAHAAVVASHALFCAGSLDEAVENARRSVALSETIWRDSKSVEDRAEAGELWSSANAQLLWCLYNQGALEVDDAWRLSDQSKPPELSARIEQLSQMSSTLDLAYAGFASDQRRLIAQRFRLQRQPVAPDTSLASAIDALQEGGAELDEMLSLVARQRRSSTAAAQADEFIKSNPTTILVDISVAASGTVVLVADSTGTRVQHAPMTRAMLAEASSAWQAAYRERRTQPDVWHKALESLLGLLGEQLLSTALDGVPRDQLSRSTVVLIPGILFGVPLHASVVGGAPLYELPLAFGYTATIRGLALRPSVPRRSICILSDIEKPPRQLQFPPGEIAEIARSLVAAGVEVTLLAQRGLEVGSRVFSTAAVELPTQANVVEHRPTPERVLELIREADHVFYTGHGTGGADHGLVLTDETGSEVLLSTLELFGAHDIRGKTIVLSACETAREPVLASAEPMSIAGALLQLGAGFLVAASWVAIDRIAAELSIRFHQLWTTNGWDPLQAFANALRQLRSSTNPTLSEWATFLPFIGVESSQP